MLRFLSAGESHGRCITVIVDGFPAGVSVDNTFVQCELKRRMAGYGRGERMSIESDRAEFTSGVRKGVTLGTPISLQIRNKDYKNWQKLMSPFGKKLPVDFRVLFPRPGHADLTGVLKRDRQDVRDILERASARETASRVAAGALAKILLAQFEISVESRVLSVGAVKDRKKRVPERELNSVADGDPLRMLDGNASSQGRKWIAEAAKEGDTVGGSFEVISWGVPPGLGDYTQWNSRLDGMLAQALMSIPAIKGVEIGKGISVSSGRGKKAHDRLYSGGSALFYFGKYRLPFHRKTNMAGGIEGGMTNGEPISVRAFMKPIPSLTVPLETVSLFDYSPTYAVRERSDVCAVPAASVVGEAMVSLVLADSFIAKFGGDCLDDMKKTYENYMERICTTTG